MMVTMVVIVVNTSSRDCLVKDFDLNIVKKKKTFTSRSIATNDFRCGSLWVMAGELSRLSDIGTESRSPFRVTDQYRDLYK